MRKQHLPLHPYLGTRYGLDPFPAWLSEKSLSLLSSQATPSGLQARQGCRLAAVSGNSCFPKALWSLHALLHHIISGPSQPCLRSLSWGPSRMIFLLQNMSWLHKVLGDNRWIERHHSNVWQDLEGKWKVHFLAEKAKRGEILEKKELNKIKIGCINVHGRHSHTMWVEEVLEEFKWKSSHNLQAFLRGAFPLQSSERPKHRFFTH